MLVHRATDLEFVDIHDYIFNKIFLFFRCGEVVLFLVRPLVITSTEKILSDDKRNQHACANDGGGHGVAGEVGQLVLALAGKQKLVNRETLHRQGFETDHGATAISDVRNHGGSQARAYTHLAGANSSINVL